MHRLDIDQIANIVLCAPVKEIRHSTQVEGKLMTERSNFEL